MEREGYCPPFPTPFTARASSRPSSSRCREPAEEIAPPLCARHPGLFVARAQSLFRQSDRAVNAGRFVRGGLYFVDGGQRLLFFDRGSVGVLLIARAEEHLH